MNSTVWTVVGVLLALLLLLILLGEIDVDTAEGMIRSVR